MSTVMIVDDNTTLAYFTARNLQRDIAGLNVVTVSSCEEARRALEEDLPRVAIVDLKLSDGNGIDLCREISHKSSGVSTILISGEVPPRPLTKNLFGFLLKPYEAEVLVALVNKALTAEGPPSENWPMPQPAATCAGYDRHALRNRLGEMVMALRAFERELKEAAHDREAVQQAIDHHIDALCRTAMEVASSLPECKPARQRSAAGLSRTEVS